MVILQAAAGQKHNCGHNQKLNMLGTLFMAVIYKTNKTFTPGRIYLKFIASKAIKF